MRCYCTFICSLFMLLQQYYSPRDSQNKNYSETATSISSFQWNWQILKFCFGFPNKFLLSCCLHIRPSFAGPTSLIIIMHASSTTSELCTKFPEMLHSLQDITLQLSHPKVNFVWEISFVHKNRTELPSLKIKYPISLPLHIQLSHKWHFTD